MLDYTNTFVLKLSHNLGLLKALNIPAIRGTQLSVLCGTTIFAR